MRPALQRKMIAVSRALLRLADDPDVEHEMWCEWERVGNLYPDDPSLARLAQEAIPTDSADLVRLAQVFSRVAMPDAAPPEEPAPINEQGEHLKWQP